MSTPKTVDDLRSRQSELIERRHQAAYSLGSAHDKEGLEQLVIVHQAIKALEAVIKEGRPGTGGVSPSLRIL
jgi:hypothetical protein